MEGIKKLTEEVETDASQYSSWLIQEIGKKADKNKLMARNLGILSVLLSSVVVFTLMFEGQSPPSIIAAIITILNSGLLVWLQLEKPHSRWRLYRKYHRIIEAERIKFLNEISPYDVPNRKKIFLLEMASLQTRLHDEWDGLIPSAEDIQKLQKGH